MQTTETGRTPALYEGVYSYRKASIAFLAVLTLALGIAGLVREYHLWKWEGFRWELLVMVLLLWPALAVLSFMGGLLLINFLRRVTIAMRITTGGIHYGKSFTPWEDVGRVGYLYHNKRIYLKFKKRGRKGIYRRLVTDDPLTGPEMIALRQRLAEEISPRFPHVTFPS